MADGQSDSLARDQFRSQTAAELQARLRQILAHNLGDALHKPGRAKRDIARVRSLEEALDQFSARLQVWLAAEQFSPSQQAEWEEHAVRLAEAWAQLPEAQQETQQKLF